MTKAEAVQSFWSGFGVPAYEMSSVPQEAQLPYITYDFSTGSFGEEVNLSASLWWRSHSWTECNAKTEEISRKIGHGGTVIPCDGGAIWIKKGQPFAQSMGDPTDQALKRKYINITAEFNTKD